MTIGNFTYEKAVDVLDEYIQKKATHGTQALKAAMKAICARPDWKNGQEQNDFAQMCRNFELWTKETERTSIGRKQFEEWWEVQGTGETGNWSEEALTELKEDAVDHLFGHFEGVDNSKTAHDLKKENAELRKRNRELEESVERYERERKKMREMLMWGLNN